jgi:hypothetical protein
MWASFMIHEAIYNTTFRSNISVLSDGLSLLEELFSENDHVRPHVGIHKNKFILMLF